MGLLALKRYVPYLRPYVGLVTIFGLAQLGSLATGASIPKVIQYIIDGPVTHHQLGQMLPLASVLVVIGILEFIFIYLRRNYSGLASLRMETDLRNDFYAHPQNLHVTFPDNCPPVHHLSPPPPDTRPLRPPLSRRESPPPGRAGSHGGFAPSPHQTRPRSRHFRTQRV